ncbi:hypothetical protein HKBW3C_00595 [Candidatus Hakubella thermalkaliphila]|nr:hypothetical protein HKBW3C_00595 [Candidatus Hakubella thermalkaliphila]
MALDERRETLKTLLRRHSDSIEEVEFSEEEILWDLDTPEEVERHKDSYKEE